MGKKILPATKRTIPRQFSFEWGKGQVIEEASIKVQMNQHSWEPAVQLLRFDDGSETLRFCVFHGRSEEHTSELQSQSNLVCRLLLEKKKLKNVNLLNQTGYEPGARTNRHTIARTETGRHKKPALHRSTPQSRPQLSYRSQTNTYHS